MAVLTMEAGAGPKIPEGLYKAVCTDVQPDRLENAQFGNGDVYRFSFQLTDIYDEHGENPVLDAIANAKLTPKSKLTEWAEALLGKKLEVGDKLDTDALIACECTVQVIVKAGSDGAEWSRIDKVLPIVGAKKGPNLESDDLALSDWWAATRQVGIDRNKVMAKSEELFGKEPAAITPQERREVMAALTK